MCHHRSCACSTIVTSCLCGYFVSPKFFLVSMLWLKKFFLIDILWVQNFSCGSFMGPKIFLLDVLWVEIFFLWVWRGSEIFSCRYYGFKFFSNGWSHDSKIMRKNDCMRKSDRKVLHLLNYLHHYTAFIWNNCIFSYLFSSVLR